MNGGQLDNKATLILPPSNYEEGLDNEGVVTREEYEQMKKSFEDEINYMKRSFASILDQLSMVRERVEGKSY